MSKMPHNHYSWKQGASLFYIGMIVGCMVIVCLGPAIELSAATEASAGQSVLSKSRPVTVSNTEAALFLRQATFGPT
ncbi:MAG: hypothetical protein ACLPX5_11765 [Dissulfurispiraceae bacterium]